MKKYFVVFILAFMSLFSQSQTKIETPFVSNFHLGGGLLVNVPAGEHADANENIGFGGSIDLAYQFTATPILVGLNGSFSIFGSETRSEPWSKTIPDVFVNVTTTNSYHFGTLFLRFQPDMKFMKPYFEGHIGFNYLQTSTSIEDQDDIGDDDDYNIASSTDLSDAGFLYGFGGGFEIPLYSSILIDEVNEFQAKPRKFELLLNLQVKYLLGQELEYLQEGDKEIIDGEVFYNPTVSKTDILTFVIGVSFKL